MPRNLAHWVRTAVLVGLTFWFAGCSGGTSDTVVSNVELAPTAVAAQPTADLPAAATVTPIPAPTASPVPTPSPEPSPTPIPTPATIQEWVPILRAETNLAAKGLDYATYVDLSDNSGQFMATVPEAWADTNGDPWDWDGELVGVALAASPDRESYNTLWGTPGVFLGASNELPFSTVEELRQEFWFGESCELGRTLDYDDGFYQGVAEVFVKCGPEMSSLIQISAAPQDNSFLIEAQFIVVTDRDWDAFLTIVDSFTVQLE